jgi:hypothetical protein
VAAGAAAALLHLPCGQLHALVVQVVPVTITVAAILAGFQATAESLLLAQVESRLVRSLSESGHYQKLVDYFRESARSLSWFIALAIAVLVMDACRVRVPYHERLVPAALAFFFVWAFAANSRVSRLMIAILRKAGAQRQG